MRIGSASGGLFTLGAGADAAVATFALVPLQAVVGVGTPQLRKQAHSVGLGYIPGSFMTGDFRLVLDRVGDGGGWISLGCGGLACPGAVSPWSEGRARPA